MNGPPIQNITKEKAQELYQRFRQLQSQGQNEQNNPEVARLGSLLRAIQQESTRQRQRQGSGEIANGALNGHNSLANGSEMKVSLDEEQLSQLKNQILAFKLLSKNMPIPPNILQALQGKQNVPETPAFVETAFRSTKNPKELLQKRISYAEHVKREHRPLIPALMPLGVDLEEVGEARERILENRIMSRIQELESMPAHVTGFQYGQMPGQASTSDVKVRLLIEMKSLKLLNKQRQIREKMLHHLPLLDGLVATNDRIQFRRMKAQSAPESLMTESQERQQRTDRERREKQKQLDYLAGITAHAANLTSDNLTRKQKVQKLGRQVLNYHSYIEKEEARRHERNAKQRLQALKADDEEAYLKLIDQAKDTRITHLLKQTNSYLDSLAEAVKAQQGSSGSVFKGKPESETEEVDADGEDEEKLDYYHIAHKISETVLEQPRILVGGTLKEYQLKGLQWMVSLYNNKLNGILADEMGLGKTIQTISLITFLIEKKKQNGPFFGAPNTRKQLAMGIRQGAFQVLLTTYEYIIKDRPILAKIQWIHMIIDEGHRMKNANSKLTITLVQYYKTRYRLILTGTPLQNNLPELWALLNFVLPKIFNSVKSFDEWFNTPFANTGGQDKMELSEEESLLVIRRLHKVLRPFLLRRLKKDVEKDLPDKVENVIKCQLSGLQKKLYEQMKKHGMLFVSDDGAKGKTGIKGLNNTLMQLRKICNHPFVFEEVERGISPHKGNDDNLWRCAGKFELLDRILPKFKRTGHRMTQIMNIMEDFLHYRGLKYMRLDGSTKADDRTALLKEFNAPDSDYFIFLLSTRAGGLGLNLQTADTVIIYDSDWNPHQDLQAQDRAHRIGQTKEVRILRLISDKSIEESILARAQYKLDIDGKVIQAGKFDNKSTAEEREAFLRSLLENDPALEDDKEEEEQKEQEEDNDEINEIIARTPEELVLFKKMDKDRDMLSLYGPTKDLPRLMSEAELPNVYHQDDHNMVEDFFATTGAGQRQRNQVSYDDGLTEEQWLQAVDNDEDLTEVIRKNNIAQGRGNRLAKSLVASPAPSSTGSRNRKSKHARAPSMEPELLPRKRARTANGNKGGDVLPPAARQAYTKVFQTVIQRMGDSVEEESGRGRTDIFVALPPKKLYPDYYQLIRRPIAIDKIKKKVKDAQYTSIHDFRADFELMFANARTYNEEGSFVWDDVAILEKIMKETLETLAPGGNLDLSVLADADEPDSADDQIDEGSEFAEEDY